MKNKKTYVITVSKTFPVKHPRAGQLTNFESLIKSKDKIHTIRKNAKLWDKRAQKINKGEAVLSVREWTGKPYRSKQRELFRFDEVGTEFINIKSEEDFPIVAETFAKNDGLSMIDFFNWFDFSVDEVYIILHFTNFRYAKQHELN